MPENNNPAQAGESTQTLNGEANIQAITPPVQQATKPADNTIANIMAQNTKTGIPPATDPAQAGAVTQTENKYGEPISNKDAAEIRVKMDAMKKELETKNALLNMLKITKEEDAKKYIELEKKQLTAEELTKRELAELQDFKLKSEQRLKEVEIDNNILKEINKKGLIGYDNDSLFEYVKVKLPKAEGDIVKALDMVLASMPKPTTPQQIAPSNVSISNPPQPNPNGEAVDIKNMTFDQINALRLKAKKEGKPLPDYL